MHIVIGENKNMDKEFNINNKKPERVCKTKSAGQGG